MAKKARQSEMTQPIDADGDENHQVNPQVNPLDNPQRMNAAEVLVATQGIGIVTAGQMLEAVTEQSQAAIVELYYSETETDKPVKIRALLDEPK